MLIRTESSIPPINQEVDRLFRHEYGKMLAVLTRLMGMDQLSVAEDIVQDTLLQAMNTWSFSGVPNQPSAWLYRVARNKAIDHLRRKRKFREITPEYTRTLQTEYSIAAAVHGLFLDNDIEESVLRMMFTCCDPSIPEEAQTALILKTLCGLSSAEIAKAFLTSEEVITKRIYRAKERLRIDQLSLDMPGEKEIIRRTDNVLHALYLLFNEGYSSSHPDQHIREDLCAEAMRLCAVLAHHSLTSFPRSNALMALFCFQASRLKARLDDNGHIILLRNQDRSKWFKPLIQKGFAYLERAAEPFENSRYHLEAAIASLHASAADFESTDWKGIYELYSMLLNLEYNPVVAMNKAIARSYVCGGQAALEEMLAIDGLEKYHLYHATLGDLYMDLEQPQEARKSFERARELTHSEAERQLLLQKMACCHL